MRAAEIQGNLADRADSAISLPIEGMTCASCVARIERSLSKVEGVQSVSVNLTTERADIQASNSVDRKALVKAVEDAGYNVPSATGIELAVEGSIATLGAATHFGVAKLAGAFGFGDVRLPARQAFGE